MSARDDDGEKRLSRRRFIKWAGGSVAVGAAAVALVEAAGGHKRRETPTRATTETQETLARSPSASAASAASRREGPLHESAFSIFWITDTQFLSESNPALFRMLNNWIVENWAFFNGKIVIHTGDVVQNGPARQEWANADGAMSILRANKLPYTWCAGNHDDFVAGDSTSGWRGNQWTDSFDPKVVSAQVNGLRYARWAGDYHEGMNTAVSFSANDLNFLVINLEWNAQPDVLRWARGILDDPAYANHHVIMAPHAYVDASGRMDDPRWVAELADFVTGFTALVEAHSSVFLTLNGHFATECGYNTPLPIDGRNQLMFDRQDCADALGDATGRGVDNPPESDADKVGGSTVTVLTFDTVNNQIRARTYDVYKGDWRTFSSEQYSVVMFPKLVSKVKVAPQ